MQVDQARSILNRWTAQELSARGIAFRENFNPVFDAKADDYRIIYEAVFEPFVLDKARLEVGITDSGHVSVGIETYERIKQRLSLRSVRNGFATGSEPVNASVEALGPLFDAVAQGRFYMTVNALLGFMSFPHLYLTKPDFEVISNSGYSSGRWLSAMPDDGLADKPTMFRKVLRYRPW